MFIVTLLPWNEAMLISCQLFIQVEYTKRIGYHHRYREWCMYSSDELFQRSWEGHFGVYQIKQQNNNQVSRETVRHDSTYIISFLTRHSESINDDKNDVSCFTRAVFVLLMTSQSIADDVTMSRQLWRDHRYIHGWSCKKYNFFTNDFHSAFTWQ